ncbi:MAG: chemotaxis protein CheW, partial [Gammaproteobacteria bacterium]|nr:chemotaxis protein CheW [Gammaproteobacteria bacterium]
MTHVNNEAALAERTAKFAAPRTSSNLKQPCQVLKFRLGKENYAIAAEHVRLSQTLSQITPLPFLRAPYLGVTLVRGQIIPMLDLRLVFEFPHVGLSDRNYVLVMGDDNDQIGLIANHIYGIQEIDLTNLQHELANLNELRQRLLVGVTA